MGKTTLPEGVSRKKKKKKAPFSREHQVAAGRSRSPAKVAAVRENGKLGGRPSLYKPEYCEQIIDLFDVDETRMFKTSYTDKKGNVVISEKEEGAKLPTIEHFCRGIRIARRTIFDWAKAHPEFRDALDVALTSQSRIVMVCGMLGYYMQPFAVMYMKNHMGWRDQLALTGPDDGPIEQVNLTKTEHDRRRAAVLKKMEQLEKRALT